MTQPDINPASVYGAIAISVLAVVVWAALLYRIICGMKGGHEHRGMVTVMPLTGFIASVGTLASAVGFGISSGTLDPVLPQQLLTVIASMGRGALLMGGALVLFYYRPSRD